MNNLALHQQRAMITVLYLVVIIGTGGVSIIVGLNLPIPNALLVDIGALEILFGIVLAKPAIRFLQRRILQDFLCNGCSNRNNVGRYFFVIKM